MLHILYLFLILETGNPDNEELMYYGATAFDRSTVYRPIKKKDGDGNVNEYMKGVFSNKWMKGNSLNIAKPLHKGHISVISWRSVLLVEGTRVPKENHRPAASHCH